MNSFADWPFMSGKLLKKGRKRRNWNERWFVQVTMLSCRNRCIHYAELS
jgi:hypothetical protein